MNVLLNKRRIGLDLVRAVAICFVLISHFAKTFEFLGFVGVECFFGLSGFLIGTILWQTFSSKNQWSAQIIINFWLRRWWRTLPSYFLFLFVSLATYQITGSDLPSINTICKFFWFGQSLFEHHTWFYGVSWSLCIEEWFYLTFPIVLFCFASIGLEKHKAFALSILLFFMFCFAVRHYISQLQSAGDMRYITIARLDSIASGVLISFITLIFKYSRALALFFLRLGIAFMISLAGIWLYFELPMKQMESNVYTLIFIPIIFSLFLPFFYLIDIPKKIFWSKLSILIEKISLCSYSIYLAHMPILDLIYYIQNILGLAAFRSNVLGNAFTKIVSFFIIMYISKFLYSNFELPMTRRRPREILPHSIL